MLHTVAELLRAAGHVVPTNDCEPARYVELKCEAVFLDFRLTRYEHNRLIDVFDGDPYVFELCEPSDAEHFCWAHTPLDSMSKMGLARRLEVMHGRNRLEAYRGLSKLALCLAVDPAFRPPKGAGKRKSCQREGGRCR